MTQYRKQAIKDVAEMIGMGFYQTTVIALINKPDCMKESEAMAVTVATAQRERVLVLEAALKAILPFIEEDMECRTELNHAREVLEASHD